jgi:hypothetical protein
MGWPRVHNITSPSGVTTRDSHAALLENPADLFQRRTGAALNFANRDTEPGGGIVSGQMLVESADDHLTVLAPERGQGGRHRPGGRARM